MNVTRLRWSELPLQVTSLAEAKRFVKWCEQRVPGFLLCGGLMVYKFVRNQEVGHERLELSLDQADHLEELRQKAIRFFRDEVTY